MSHSYYTIWIHAVWSTKDRLPLISADLEQILYPAIENEFLESGCSVSIINGMPDYVHCLFKLNPNLSLAATIKQVKGASSHFINESKLIPDHFCWQSGYAAFSVSRSGLLKVYRYIKYQKRRHGQLSYLDEYRQFIK